ncbi:uncharacterized protein LOC110459612 [Mizuhopecten yessoensis]|uniref:uncharacterized protein LOC110459612 n=1 Tax=Mizuhopecten yessoensis TaxID=6573 RepID=UPI000B45A491|nr:uncharacterized protein LOC110459612 [Mizuhopecten yessoensis]
MPAKRKKATPKGKKTKNSGNSSGASSESEGSKTLEILNKISQKFMGSCRQKNGHKKQPASEIGYEADEDTSTTGTSDMSTQSPAQASLYDFDEPDYEMQISPHPVKSTKAKAKTSTTRSKKTPTDKKQRPVEPAVKKGKKSNKLIKDSSSNVKPVQNKSSVLKKTNSHNQENISTNLRSEVKSQKTMSVNVNSLVSNSPMFSKTPVVTLQRLDVSNVEGYESFQRQLRKRKCETPKDQTTPQLKPKVLKQTPILKNVTSSSKRQPRKRDSGVLMSPPSIRKIPAPASTDTSTPSNVVSHGKQKHSDHNLLNESCFGFDTSVSFGADTPFQQSPIKSKALPPLTPLSDYVSMDSMHISCEDIFRRQSVDNDAEVPELFSVQQDDLSLNRSTAKSYKLSSKRRPKKTVSTMSKSAVLKKSKADDIAEKFNTEFDEIEKFQLSIEEL